MQWEQNILPWATIDVFGAKVMTVTVLMKLIRLSGGAYQGLGGGGG